MVFKTAISSKNHSRKKRPPHSGTDEDQHNPPDLVLITPSESDDWLERLSRAIRNSGKPLVAAIAGSLVLTVAWDSLVRAPQDRWIRPQAFSTAFLLWVQAHPLTGIVAIVLAIATAVVLMIPIGTPLTVGCGYIYKGAFGWKLGLTLATIVAMGGSALGAVTCFLLGRYLMRDQVRKWIRKYPLFDAIDVGACMLCFASFAVFSFCACVTILNVQPAKAAILFTVYMSLCLDSAANLTRFSPLCVFRHGSRGRTRSSHHGHVVLDSRPSSRPGQLHVWNHIHGIE